MATISLWLDVEIMAELINPDWDDLDLCNEWKRYVPDEIREQWNILTFQEKALVAYMASQEANHEEWD